MKLSKTTRDWLQAVMNHATGFYQDEAGCRDVLTTRRAECENKLARAIEWRHRCNAMHLSRGTRQSASLQVSRCRSLIRWADLHLETLSKIGFEKFRDANRGWRV